MPAVSKAQRRLFAMALQYKQGDLPEDQASDEIKQLAKLSKKELEDYAKTKEADLPHHVESVEYSYKNLPTFEEFVDSLNEFGSNDKELQQLKNDILTTLRQNNMDAKMHVFHSGYDGISIEIPGYQKFMIFDQPGRVGMEDQTMPYIVMQYGGSLDSPKLFYASPEYSSRGFGRVQMDNKMRTEIYTNIIDFFGELPEPNDIKKFFIKK